MQIQQEFTHFLISMYMDDELSVQRVQFAGAHLLMDSQCFLRFVFVIYDLWVNYTHKVINALQSQDKNGSKRCLSKVLFGVVAVLQRIGLLLR